MSILNFISETTGISCIPDCVPHPEQAITLDILGFKQIDDYSCGAVAGWIVVRSFHRGRSFEKFYDLCRPHPERGTPTRRLANALRQSGIGVQLKRLPLSFEEISQYIDDGFPIICAVDHDKRDIVEHWLVIYGYQKRPNKVYVTGDGGWMNFLGFSLFGKHDVPWRIFSRMCLGDSLICWKWGRGNNRIVLPHYSYV